jgi:hypothetical protein
MIGNCPNMYNLLDIGYNLLKIKHKCVTCPRLLQRLTLLDILHPLSQTSQVNYILDLRHNLRFLDLLPLNHLRVRLLRLLHVLLVLLCCLLLLFCGLLQVLSYPFRCIFHFFYLRFIIFFESHGLSDHHVKFLSAHHLTHLNIEVIATFKESIRLYFIPHILLLH